jgi:Raf kinase inhibitor-like YbhB/YbcL family protein
MRSNPILLLILLLAGATAGGPLPSRAAGFDLTSPEFSDGSMLAQKNAGKYAANKDCDGQNVSPPLAWTGAPNGTKTYAMILIDPLPNGGLGFVHWVAYDIPASKLSLKEGEASAPPTEFKGGKSTPGLPFYFGPCPPRGDKPHPYVFTLIATDLEAGTLKAGLTREELGEALRGHVLGSTSLVARYGH